jgi:hypothetical protein
VEALIRVLSRPLPTDQVNLTDEEPRIMPVAGVGFEQCCNAQAVVATIVVQSAFGQLGCRQPNAVQNANDKQRPPPMLNKVVAFRSAGQSRNGHGG